MKFALNIFLSLLQKEPFKISDLIEGGREIFFLANSHKSPCSDLA